MSEPSAPPPPPQGEGSQGAPPPPQGGESPQGAPPPPSGAAASSNQTVMFVLSYLGLLALIPWLVEKNDPEVQWHAKNGLVFTVFMIICWFVTMVIAVVPILGWIVAAVAMLVLPLGWLIFAIMGIVKATQGQRFVVPVLSDFVEKF